VIALMCFIGVAAAIDVNDQVELTLDGGESVQGWFVRGEPGHVVIHLPKTGDTTRIPLSMLSGIEVNGARVSSEAFEIEIVQAYEAWLQWRSDPPAHPGPVWVAVSSIALAGSGHALLGDWQNAAGLIVADTVGMSVAAWEFGHQQRINVLLGAVAVSTIMKAYGVSNGSRKARARRRKLGLEAGR
jgi:hypothetical protein